MDWLIMDWLIMDWLLTKSNFLHAVTSRDKQKKEKKEEKYLWQTLSNLIISNIDFVTRHNLAIFGPKFYQFLSE